MRIARGRRIVQSLVKEGPGLLPAVHVVVEAETVQRKDCLQNRLPVLQKQRRFGRYGQAFQLADARVGPFHDRAYTVYGQLRRQHLAQVVLCGCLRQQLHNHKVVIAVRDDARQAVRFAEDESQRVRLAGCQHGRAKSQRRTNPGLHVSQIFAAAHTWFGRNVSQRQLAAVAEERGTERDAAAVQKRDERARRDDLRPKRRYKRFHL